MLSEQTMVNLLSFWTKFNGEESHLSVYDVPYRMVEALDAGAMTIYELINAVTTPLEQVEESLQPLLATILQTATGGDPSVHAGTGGGGSESDLRWDGRNPNDRPRRSRR